MKALMLAVWLLAPWLLAAGPAMARDGVPTVPQPPASARTLPDACLGTACPKKVDPARNGPPCLGASCPGPGYGAAGAAPGAGTAPAPWSGPAQPRLPPMPSQPGQVGHPVGPLTPGSALPR